MAGVIAQIGEGAHGHQGGNPPPHRSPNQGPGGRSREGDEGRSPQQQQQHQSLDATGPDPAVPHRLEAAVAGGQAIGRIHGAIEVEAAAEPDRQGQHQGHLG